VFQHTVDGITAKKTVICRKELQVDNKTLNDFLKELHYKYNILDHKYS